MCPHPYIIYILRVREENCIGPECEMLCIVTLVWDIRNQFVEQ